MFRDRQDAANKLARALEEYRGKRPLVLAIPRGAVPMGKIIAKALDGELDVVLVRKLRAPGNPELAIGSVDETGWTYLADYSQRMPEKYIEEEKSAQMAVMRERRASYTPIRAPIDPSGRIVIVVDDGLATGSTMIAALHALRAKKPEKLVCAVPVAPSDTLERIEPYADQVVCLETPDPFYAVGQFYQAFPQVEDEEVVEILQA